MNDTSRTFSADARRFVASANPDDEIPSRSGAALPACPPVHLTPEEQAALKAAPVIVANLEGGAHRVRVVRRVVYEQILVRVEGERAGRWIDSSRLEEPAAEPPPTAPPPLAPLGDYEPARDAAARLGCDSRTIRRAICSGELPGICREGRWFAWRPEVDRRVATLREVADRLSVSSLSNPREASDDDIA